MNEPLNVIRTLAHISQFETSRPGMLTPPIPTTSTMGRSRCDVDFRLSAGRLDAGSASFPFRQVANCRGGPGAPATLPTVRVPRRAPSRRSAVALEEATGTLRRGWVGLVPGLAWHEHVKIVCSCRAIPPFSVVLSDGHRGLDTSPWTR